MYIHEDILFVYMSKVLIYIPTMKLKLIDAYCKEKGISRSRLLVRGAMSMAHSQMIPKCNFCFNASVGKYRISVHDWETGEKVEERFLCQSHLQKAQAEGEVEDLDK